jgi:hypothetical protein
MNIPQPNKKRLPAVNDNILESLRGVGSSVGKTISHDVAGKIPSDILASLLGQMPQNNELKQNQAVDVNPERPMPFPFRRPEIVRPPIVHADEIGIKQKIEAVRQELVALSASVKKLNTEIDKAVNEIPINPGVYHLNFLERLKSIIKMMRENIDNGQTWLQSFNSRKQKRQYWGMYKKHGTSFGLSNERTLATQAG